jgi:Holliday junction resolvase RusA-like endonuclease
VTWALTFNYPSPPITANQRHHWRKKATLTKQVRVASSLLARSARIPAMAKCEVSLIWFVSTKHRRDVDNIVPTLKAMCDGLVDAGIVPDDTPNEMVKHMPEIVYMGAGKKPYMQLAVEMIQ